MGARTIAGILDRGPRPALAVLHAQDDPPELRRWLAANGWHIDAEGLAPEAGRFAEVIRAVPGEESAEGLWLDYGPRLLTVGDPLLLDHLDQLMAHHENIARATDGRDSRVHDDARRRADFLRARVQQWS